MSVLNILCFSDESFARELGKKTDERDVEIRVREERVATVSSTGWLFQWPWAVGVREISLGGGFSMHVGGCGSKKRVRDNRGGAERAL